MSVHLWGKRNGRKPATAVGRARRDRDLRSIRLLEQCEDRTLMATALGVTGADALIRFDTATPGTIIASTPITGLVGGDTIVGLDFRPATGQLYGLGSGSRLYTIDPTTAVATQVGASGAFTLNGAAFGFDFNPVPDRIRVTSDTDQNIRLNPNDGTLAGTDGNLAYATTDPNAGANPSVVASAYTNSFGGATTTTLYDIDSALNTLVIQDPPNNGTLTTVGPLGVDVQAVAGFDIQTVAGTNLAFASLTTDGTSSSLYTTDLTTGAATLVGSIGATSTLVGGLAIVPVETPTAVLYGINAANDNLIRVNSNNPSTIISSLPITGLVSGDTIVGLDFRPATGQLYGLGSGSHLYTINPATGVATQVGANGAFTLNGAAFGFDFNPVPDRIRVTSDLEQNIRLNPNDGTLAGTDTALAYASGDPNAGINPSVVASAYTNSVAGATTTTLYDIDSGLDRLVTQNPPNDGTLNTVGPLGVDAQGVAGFDIQTVAGTNLAFAALTTDGVSSSLYTIDLTTGAATLVGTAPIGGTATPLLVRALAVAPFGAFQFSSATYSASESGRIATITVNRALGSEGIASVRLTTSNGTATAPADYTAFDQVLIFGPGVTSQTVQIPIVNDGITEVGETVNLTLTAATGGAVLGTPSAAVLTITAPTQMVPNDYDGDGKSDVAVYLTSLGAFGIRPSGGGADQLTAFGIAGAGQSIPVQADFTGQGRSELAIYLPSQGAFAFRPSFGGPDVIVPFGIAGQGETIPATGDYFGTGQTDLAVYLPAFGSFAIRNPAGGPDVFAPFGIPGAGQSIPAPGDYDGDGKADLVVYLPSIGAFGIRPSRGGPDQILAFGPSGAGQTIPTPGDFDGDGKTDLAAYLPSLGIFAYRPSSGGPDVLQAFGPSGAGQTLPAIGDYLGSGRSQVAAYLPGQGAFAIRPGGGQPDSIFPFGIAGTGQSIPVTAVVDQALEQMVPMATAASVAVPNTELAVDVLSSTTAASKKKTGAL